MKGHASEEVLELAGLERAGRSDELGRVSDEPGSARIINLTEPGRAVHAGVEAILSVAPTGGAA